MVMVDSLRRGADYADKMKDQMARVHPDVEEMESYRSLVGEIADARKKKRELERLLYN